MIYTDLPRVRFHPPEPFVRNLLKGMDIKSVLDVGAGHGGVFDMGNLDCLPMQRKAACDIKWIRELSPGWETRLGVDACRLTDFYAPASFDMVQCMEVLEHVDNPRKALEELCAVARKFVLVSSADERHHTGPEQAAIEKVNPHQAYRNQPAVEDLKALGFTVCVDEVTLRQLVAWKKL